MKIVGPEEIDKYNFIGGEFSPTTLFKNKVSHAGAIGSEIVELHFINTEEAKKAYEFLKSIGVVNVQQKGKTLVTWPVYLKQSPLQEPKRKYKFPYQAMKILSIFGDLYYNEATGEIIIDDFDDKEAVENVVKKFNQKVYVVHDEERHYVSILPVDYVVKGKEGEIAE